jgi:hypothetical protein
LIQLEKELKLKESKEEKLKMPGKIKVNGATVSSPSSSASSKTRFSEVEMEPSSFNSFVLEKCENCCSELLKEA